MPLLADIGSIGFTGMALVMVLWAVILGLGCYLVYFGLSLPFRRREQAGMVLDLIETELKKGSGLERGLVAISHSHDRELGVQFHLFAAYLEHGLRFVEALEKTPHLLPPEMVAMLKVGEEIGDLKQVLPACRKMLHDATSTVQSAVNYLVVLAFVVTPIVPLLTGMIAWLVLPKFSEIFIDMEGEAPPVLTAFVSNASTCSALLLGLAAVLYGLTLLYLGGPYFRAKLARYFSPLSDQLVLKLPWKRKRLLRDFTALLSVLLDAQVPEPRAISLAAAATRNAVFLNRAEEAGRELQLGSRFPDLVGRFDSTGELRWRMENAIHGRSGFLRALAGWHEALEARAYRLEQSVAHILTTALVILNGLLVGITAAVVFNALISVININLLW